MAGSKQIVLQADDGKLDINQLFRLYSKPLFYYACKFVDEDPAKDIVQDVFLKLWDDRSIQVNESLNGLLFTMVRNKCLQLIEKEKVRAGYANRALLALREQEIQYYEGESHSIIQKELMQQLEEAINRLPDKCREVFILSRYHDKKNREIAEELGISVKAVEKQITKALHSIRKDLKDYLPLFLLFFKSL